MRSGPPPETRETPAHFRALHLGRSSSPRAHCQPVGCHPNARVARAFPSGSPLQTREAPAQFGAVHSEKTSPSRARFSDVAPPPTEGLSGDCGRAPRRKRARPARISGRFICANRVPHARTANRLNALYTVSLSLVGLSMKRKRARAARVSNIPTVVLSASSCTASLSL